MDRIDRLKSIYLYLTIFITGAAILVIEIAGTRVLAPFYGSTIFVWSSLITVTLGALALGYFAGGYFADKYPRGQIFYGIIFAAGLLIALLIKINEPALVWSNRFGFQWGTLVATAVLFSLPLFFLGMVTPFAIRLRAISVEHAGHTSGTIFAIATVGSVAGALLTGFYLLPNFFVSSIISVLSMGIMAVAIVGMIVNKISWHKTVSAVIFALILYYIPFATSVTNKQVTLLHKEPSFYGEIQVVERDGFRCMSIGSSTQGCMKLSTGDNALWYIGLMELLLEPAEGRLLTIGLGGGMIPRDMREHFDAVDVVDVDLKVRRVAEEFFNYDDSHPSLTTYINDGRAFLWHNAKKYNAIALDVFAGSNLAPHLFTQEAFEAMRAALAPGGILVINTTGRPYGEGSELPRSIFKTLNTAFPYLGVLSTENIKENPEKFGNLIFVASNEPKEFPVSREFVILYDASDIEDAHIFTDARNPIEIIGAPVYEEAQKFNRALFGTL